MEVEWGSGDVGKRQSEACLLTPCFWLMEMFLIMGGHFWHHPLPHFDVGSTWEWDEIILTIYGINLNHLSHKINSRYSL